MTFSEARFDRVSRELQHKGTKAMVVIYASITEDA
jgi:hypothetical protein